MARNLVRAGVDLVVFDTDASAVQRLVDSGAKAAASVSELASQARVIFTSLPGPIQVEEVVLGRGGILESSRWHGVVRPVHEFAVASAAHP